MGCRSEFRFWPVFLYTGLDGSRAGENRLVDMASGFMSHQSVVPCEKWRQNRSSKNHGELMISALRVTVALCAALFLCVAIQPAAAQNSKGHAYLFRGLGGVFSMGLDDLASKLEARGIETTVTGHGSWSALVDQAAAESRRNRGAPIILIGHSLGADAAIQMAERLTAMGAPPRLVVTFDPVGVDTVGPARGRFINFFQSNNGYGKRLRTEKGFRGSLTNYDLAGDSSLDHFNIDKSPRLHAEVVSRARALTAPKKVAPRPKPASAPAAPAAPSGPETEPAPVPPANIPDAPGAQVRAPAPASTSGHAPM